MSKMIGRRSFLLILACCLQASGQSTRVESPRSKQADENGAFSLGDDMRLEVSDSSITINVLNKQIEVLTGILGRDMDTRGMTTCHLQGSDSGSGLCFQWEKGPRLEVYETVTDRFKNSSNIKCSTVNWTLPEDAGSVTDTPEDCYSMANYFWFGGYEESTQTWPINSFQIGSSPFITGDGYRSHEYSDVIEGLFISSAGTGISVNETTPLYLSINDGGSQLLCLKGKVGATTPFFQIAQPFLLYDICRSTDITTLWKGMAERYIPKPKSYPSLDVIRHPIWCTWAPFKGNINYSAVLEFAENITSFNYGISQLEIDDNWTPHYGDFTFNTKTFPDAKELIANLTTLGITTTVWVHWFFNNDSNAFRELSKAGYLIKEYSSDKPLLVPWWRGNYAGVLDFTHPDAVTWYLNKLSYLKSNYNVTSFKFDAGEVKWIKAQRYKLSQEPLTPNYFTKKYAEAAFQADTVERRQEVRVGFKSQASSNMVRMVDRDSNWSHDQGIKTIIPCALVFGFMGYPYILPDLIGGNAYDPSNIDITVLPEPELFIRWLQVSVFMPVLQFSVAPWAYNNDTISKISLKFIKLHEQYADKIIYLTKNAQQTGEPIIRPLWWIAPTDTVALALDTEFLLGDDLLVAPILEKGARSRDIYLPAGNWRSVLTDTTVVGGTWLRNFKADLEELPYFIKLN